MELSSEQKNLFHDTGLLYLQKYIPRKSTGAVKELIETELERLKLKGKDKSTSSRISSLPFFQQITHLSQAVKVEESLEKLFPPELKSTMENLAGTRLTSAAQAQLLLSLPQKEEWSLKKLNWHLDLAVPKRNEISGVQAFILIDDVKTKGGATLALAGSHKLHYVPEAQNGKAHGVLRRDKLFSELYTAGKTEDDVFMKPHEINGVKVFVAEMSGHAGDVYLMDLRVLHSPSINASKNVRMMATNRFIR